MSILSTWGRALRSGIVAIAAAALPAAATAAQPPASDTVRVSIVAERSAVRPSDQIAVAVVFEMDEGWHIHTNEPKIPASWGDFPATPTTITVEPGPGVTVGPIQWPTPYTINVDLAGTGTPEPFGVFEGPAYAFVPIEVGAAAAGEVKLTFRIGYQACDDTTCQFPQTIEQTLTIPVVALGTTTQPADDPTIFETFDRTSFAKIGTAGAANSSTKFSEDVFGWKIEFDAVGAGLLLLLLLACVGGFVLNLTPCVLPVIPLKIMGLTHSAGSPRRAMILGVIMSAGVIAFWLAIATMMVTVSGFTAVNQLFQKPAFTIGIGVFIAAMALGMMGLFTLNLPGVVYLVDPKKESPAGSFLFGVMTAVLSTPCTAPFMAGAVAWSTKQPAWVTLATFGAIGVGMSLPYLVLAMFPKLLSRVPRSGPGSELVKQVMGVLMFGVAVFFLGSGVDPLLREPVDEPIRWHWYIVAACVVGAFAFALARGVKIRLKTATLTVVAVLGLALGGGMSYFAYKQNQRGPVSWVGYTPARFDEAVRAGKVVVLDFTAEWCLNCKALKGQVLYRPEIAALLNAEHVEAFKVDLTGPNPDGQAKLKELGWAGIPLLAVYGPAIDQPVRYDSYTPAMVTEAMERAKGN
ncbi:MAG TPA: cytochrome c biogenesis protein CcdA [Phycisphaerales bacterium]|nr:cytochrome c biogenesis protein CcdA [Phycisphaerales bacterium]